MGRKVGCVPVVSLHSTTGYRLLSLLDAIGTKVNVLSSDLLIRLAFLNEDSEFCLARFEVVFA